MYISTEIGRNLTEWLELTETGQNLTQGGKGCIIVLDCIPVRDILARIERN